MFLWLTIVYFLGWIITGSGVDALMCIVMLFFYSIACVISAEREEREKNS